MTNQRHSPQRKATSSRLLWLLCFAPLSLLLPGGCDTTGDNLHSSAASGGTEASRLVNTSASPRSTIELTVRAYQQLQSYQDDAYVRLRYDLDGQRLEDRAPLAVAWEKSGRIGLRVYSVSAGPTADRWRLRLSDADSTVPQQVLSRAIPERVDFGWLLSDPLVAQRMSAGLAGFPPQLDLLLAPQPLQGLVDKSAELSYGQPEDIDGRLCWVIHVNRGPNQFTLWIDQNDLLLRRLGLPRSHLTPEMIGDGRVSNVELTIEFAGARGDAATDWSQFEVAPKTDELRVNRFVPSPIWMDTSGLGEQVPGFHLESPQGEPVYQSNASAPRRKATVLLWLADHPACRVASEQMQRVAEALPALGVRDGAVEFVMVWAEPQPPAGTSFATLVDDWKMPGQLALDRDAMGRDFFNVQEAPTLVVVDQNNRLQLRESRSNPLLDRILPQLLSRIVAGENLAEELVSKQNLMAQRHRIELAMAAAVDASPANDSLGQQPYTPETFTLRKVAASASKATAVAVNSDAQGNVWTLYNTGQLRRDTADSLAQLDSDAADWIDTRWTTDPGQGQATSAVRTSSSGRSKTGPADGAGLGSGQLRGAVRIEVSPKSKYVAYVKDAEPAVQWIDIGAHQNRTIELESGDYPIDFRWLPAREASTASLAVITDKGRTLLIDPTDRQQMSGHSSVAPLALLPAADQAPGTAGYVVLADRSIQPLQVSAASGATRPAATNGSVAFQPDRGPWILGHDSGPTLTLARGWLAAGEPAVFLLDEQRKQHWHYRMPLERDAAAVASSVGNDPTSGQAVWAVLSGQQTIHILRADGRIIDHFRSADPVVGLALQPNGARLELTVIHPRQAIRYALDWNTVDVGL